MHGKNTSARVSAQHRYIDFADDGLEWKARVKGARPAAVLPEQDPRAVDSARAIPACASPVKVATLVAGYRLTPAQARRRFDFLEFRFFEIDRLARWRVMAGEALHEQAFAIAVSSCAEPNMAESWIKRACPTLAFGEIAQFIAAAHASPTYLTAAALGDLLGLTTGERENLGIRTFRPAGMKPAEFRRYAHETKKENNRVRAEGKRRAAGIQPRPKGCTAKAKAAAYGMSVSAYYRHRAAGTLPADTEREPKVATGYVKKVICDFQFPPAAPPWMLIALADPIGIIPATDRADTARIGILVAAQAASQRAATIHRAA